MTFGATPPAPPWRAPRPAPQLALPLQPQVCLCSPPAGLSFSTSHRLAPALPFGARRAGPAPGTDLLRAASVCPGARAQSSSLRPVSVGSLSGTLLFASVIQAPGTEVTEHATRVTGHVNDVHPDCVPHLPLQPLVPLLVSLPTVLSEASVFLAGTSAPFGGAGGRWAANHTTNKRNQTSQTASGVFLRRLGLVVRQGTPTL